jgi:hypothetical protein
VDESFTLILAAAKEGPFVWTIVGALAWVPSHGRPFARRLHGVPAGFLVAVHSPSRLHGRMDLFLCRVRHPQSRDNYRVIAKVDGDEIGIEIGSIGIQYGRGTTASWVWGVDFVIPMRSFETEGTGLDRKDCMRQFRAAWDKFSADPARLTEFLEMKR